MSFGIQEHRKRATSRIAALLDAIEAERPGGFAIAAWIGAEKSTWKPPDGAFSGHSHGFGAEFPTRIRENAARTL